MMVVAELVMSEWDLRFREKMKENQKEVLMDETYVDDQDLFIEELRLGERWNGSKISWSREWEEMDLVENLPADTRTMREVRKLSNSIMDFIVMEEDVPSNHPDNKLPILDLKVWIVQVGKNDGSGDVITQIATEFYEKPMVGDMLMMEKSSCESHARSDQKE